MEANTLYTEPAYYRMLFRERTHDRAFYERVTRAGQTVLELGVGEGRMALALAEADRRVLGVDLSEDMLAALERRKKEHSPTVAARVTAMRGDARTLRLRRSFDRVIQPFNGLAHFHDPDSLAELLATVRAHLSPGGVFAFDVMLPDPRLLAGGASSVPRVEHPRTGRVCRVEERYDYDALRQVLTVTTTLVDRESGDAQTLTLLLRQLFPQETLLLLEHHGFEVVERTEELGDSLGYVCRRRN